MADFQLSSSAVTDLRSIADYTLEAFGLEQSRRYRDELHEAFSTLAEHSEMGVAVDWLHLGARRYPHQSHVVFYTATAAGILVLRVLHKSMDAPQHFA